MSDTRSDSVPESPYADDFIEKQIRRLLDERKSVLEGIEIDEEELRSWTDDGSGVDQHAADDAMALTERELDAGLIENAQHIINLIDDALRRIEKGTYGWDQEAEVWIREERLEALPWAQREVEGQSRLESKGKDRPIYRHDDDMTTI